MEVLPGKDAAQLFPIDGLAGEALGAAVAAAGDVDLDGVRDLVASASSPFKVGTLVPVPSVLTLVLVTDGTGGFPLAWPAWPSGLSGVALHCQYTVQDAGALEGVVLGNALRADVP